MDGNKSIIEERYKYDLKYCVPIEVKPGSYFNLQITYFYCPSKICTNVDELMHKSVTKTVQMVQHFVVIMGETDKPLYRPGEQVRFRLIALTSRHILPYSELTMWPEYEAVSESSAENVLKRIDPGERERRMEAPHFDLIEIKDPLNNILYQWKDVRPLDALNLVYKLIRDAKEGEWKIEACVRHQKEVVFFNVRHYVLPLFRVHVELPGVIDLSRSDVKIGVCAAYINGPLIRGTYDAQICICDGSVLKRQQVEARMFPRNKCVANSSPVVRLCTRVNGILDDVSCTNITVDTLHLVKDKSASWNERLAVFVEVVEEGTASSVFSSGITELRTLEESQIELILPDAYKNGLPTAGQVIYKNMLNKTDDKVEVVVREIPDKCDYYWRFKKDTFTTITKVSVKPG
ncbi:unnamed protein product, partial [Hydatigera taeniaeformis]|uniref:MG3 domain-containing protein n=1 Tax=Hydatigena taeniaeformis TaxID=6205 RepID=A0A0R3XC34_HYDTA